MKAPAFAGAFFFAKYNFHSGTIRNTIRGKDFQSNRRSEGGSSPMHFYDLNLLAVLAAAMSTMVVGFLWYSPMLFARPWMVAMGFNPDDKEALAKMQKEAGAMYGMAFVASLVAAFFLALVLTRIGA